MLFDWILGEDACYFIIRIAIDRKKRKEKGVKKRNEFGKRG